MTTDAELAIRRYLMFLEDPASVVDAEKLDSLEAKLAASHDAIERLHLHAAIEQARKADGESVRADFVRSAKPYAQKNGLTVGAFRAMGVSDIALVEAGFDVGHGKVAARRRAPAHAAATDRKRAPKVPQSRIREHILSVTGTFTLNDIIGDVGGSVATVNSVVKDLIAAGSVRSLGPDKEHSGRGRAPIRYERV